jgi:hypothetical protein
LFSQEYNILGTNGYGPERSGASQHRNTDDQRERRADRAEMVAIAISFLLIISAVAVIIGIVLLSRPSRHVPAQWIPRISALATPSREATSLVAGGSGRLTEAAKEKPAKREAPLMAGRHSEDRPVRGMGG